MGTIYHNRVGSQLLFKRRDMLMLAKYHQNRPFPPDLKG